MDLRVENQEDEQDQDSDDSDGQEPLLLHSVNRSDVKDEAEEKRDCMISLNRRKRQCEEQKREYSLPNHLLQRPARSIDTRIRLPQLEAANAKP